MMFFPKRGIKTGFYGKRRTEVEFSILEINVMSIIAALAGFFN